jgi:hypothetical protein
MAAPWEAYAKAQKAAQQAGPWGRYATPDVISEMGTGERLLAGIGKGMTDVYRGGKQLLNIGDQEALKQEIEESRRLDAPLVDTGAGFTGNLIGQGAIAAPAAFIPGANTLVGSALMGGGMGALQPTLTDEENTSGVLMGAAGGAAGKKLFDVFGRAIAGRAPTTDVNVTGGGSSASSTASGSATARGTGGGYNFGTVGDDVSAGLNESRRQAMAAGKKLGMQLTPGQASGSRALQ